MSSPVVSPSSTSHGPDIPSERSPNSTPVPANPNPKFASSIPALLNSRRQSSHSLSPTTSRFSSRAEPLTPSKAGVQPKRASLGASQNGNGRLHTPQAPSNLGVSNRKAPSSSARSIQTARSSSLSVISSSYDLTSPVANNPPTRPPIVPNLSAPAIPISQINNVIVPNSTPLSPPTAAKVQPKTPVKYPGPGANGNSPSAKNTPPAKTPSKSPAAAFKTAPVTTFTPLRNGANPSMAFSPRSPEQPISHSAKRTADNNGIPPHRILTITQTPPDSIHEELSEHDLVRNSGWRPGDGFDPAFGIQEEGSMMDDRDGTMSMDLYTDVDENDLDEDVQVAFDSVRMVFMRKLNHYKRLLEQAHSSSASQLHALQAELRILRLQLESERQTLRTVEIKASQDREALVSKMKNQTPVSVVPAIQTTGSYDIISALRGDGKGSFDERAVRQVVRSLQIADRMRLIHLILDSCLPGDISQMIRLLEKYAASTFDLITSLPQDIAAKSLSYLSIHELLEVGLVSKAWHAITRHPSIWRRYCLELTATDPVPLRWPQDVSQWEPLYKSLHHRERNFSLGLSQSIRFLRGHTNFCTTLILKGNRLISGSYDETIRFWDIRSGKETHCLKAKAVSCLDFLPEEEVLVAGYHDVGRVQVYSTVTWALLQTLQGHLYGIRSVAITPNYVVSAGADKAIVCWDWRSGQKLVRFGQQTNLNIGVQVVDEETVVGVTIDGIVRTFSIRRKEMISQFKLSDLAVGDPTLAVHLSQVGMGPNNMLQWFAAKGRQITCATKSVILHLQWNEADKNATSPELLRVPLPSPQTPSQASRDRLSLSRSTSTPSPITPRRSLGGSLASSTSKSPRYLKVGGPKSSINMALPPKLLAVISTPDVAVGAVDPLKKRVTTATRFSSRAGADRRIFISTYDEGRLGRLNNLDVSSTSEVDFETPITTVTGAWSAAATGQPEDMEGIHNIPPDFKGLATPNLNPMSMALSHEEVVVGCADGTIYVMSFVGHKYGRE